ncbi:hypothetical protein Landi51_11474 [Colletotrichum acutatum]
MGLVQNGESLATEENVPAISASLSDAMASVSESRLPEDEELALSGCDAFQSAGGLTTLAPMSMRIFYQSKMTLQKKGFVLKEIVERSMLVKAKTKSYFDPDRMIEHEVTIPVTPAAASGKSLRHIEYYLLGA